MIEVKDVVAALIRDGNKFLICRRPPEKARGLLWEFVGGKVESGETFEEALKRECLEELSISVRPLDVFDIREHEYPDIKIRLTLYNAVIERGIITLNEHIDARWITKDEIPLFDFCPADEEILKKIRAEF
ncbi:MAG: (deoxy)nucleoside triphosphate pyrophosphohydrolase [Clostridiales bacterium]|nr:(deoxy)nucleoside triphosphate pyrophosphohydrolase [Candidatus Coliplasma equi]